MTDLASSTGRRCRTDERRAGVAPPGAERTRRTLAANACARSSPTCALAATRHCSNTRDASMASRSRRLEVSTAEFAAAETRARRGAARSARSRDRQRAALSRSAARRRRCASRRRLASFASGTFRADRCRRTYVPAGVAPLPSAAIMLAVPARIAGCPTRIICTPPRRDGTADPAVLTIAQSLRRAPCLQGRRRTGDRRDGVRHATRSEGRQGLRSWQLVGDGGEAAGRQRSAMARRSICPAGPSEVLVIADATARAEFVAADLLAQAEHSADAQVVLVTTSSALAEATAGTSSRRRCSGSVARHGAQIDRARPPVRRRLARCGVRAQQRVRARASDRAGRECTRTGCRRFATPVRFSSAPGRRRRWATTAAVRITCCRPTGSHAPTAACRCTIS